MSDRNRPFRVMPPPHPTPTPGSTPSLTRSQLGQAIEGLPPWLRGIVLALALGAGSGAGLAGVSKWLGIETTASADAREGRLIERIARGESRVTDLEQMRRKEGLSKKAQADVSRVVEEALSRVANPRTKRKPKPVEPRPADTEAETP